MFACISRPKPNLVFVKISEQRRPNARMLGRRSDARALGRSDARVFGRPDVRTSERPDVRTPGRSDAYSPHFQFLRPPRRGPEPGRTVTSRAAPALAAAAAKIAKKTNEKRKIGMSLDQNVIRNAVRNELK